MATSRKRIKPTPVPTAEDMAAYQAEQEVHEQEVVDDLFAALTADLDTPVSPTIIVPEVVEPEAEAVVETIQKVSVSERTMLWGRIGTIFDTPPSSAAEALALGGLDWDVEVRDAGFRGANDSWNRIPGQFVTVRTDTDQPLGMVKSRYKSYGNREFFDFCDTIVDESGAVYEAVWSYNDSRVVGLTLRLPDTITVDGEVQFGSYLLAQTSHDGSSSVRVTVQNVALACLNQVNAKLAGAAFKFKMVHAGDMNQKVHAARESLKLAKVVDAKFEEEIQRMINTPVSNDRAERIIREAAAAARHSDRATDGLVSSIKLGRMESPTIRDQDRGSAYGLVSAVTEYFQHGRRYRTPEAGFQVNTFGLGARLHEAVLAAV